MITTKVKEIQMRGPIFPLLPPSITRLSFFLQDAAETEIIALPPLLTHLSLSSYFNQVLSLPSFITHLTFGYLFNQPVNNLPTSLKYLAVGKTFNQEIDNLPASLTHLILGENFNKPLENLPPLLVLKKEMNLMLQRFFSTAINIKYTLLHLPKTLVELSIGHAKRNDLIHLSSFPNLKKLNLNITDSENGPPVPFPPNISDLTLHNLVGYDLNLLPSTVTHLALGARFDNSLDKLPPSLISLNVGIRFNQKVDSLPLNLQYLTLGYYFNQEVNNLPQSLIKYAITRFSIR